MAYGTASRFASYVETKSSQKPARLILKELPESASASAIRESHRAREDEIMENFARENWGVKIPTQVH